MANMFSWFVGYSTETHVEEIGTGSSTRGRLHLHSAIVDDRVEDELDGERKNDARGTRKVQRSDFKHKRQRRATLPESSLQGDSSSLDSIPTICEFTDKRYQCWDELLVFKKCFFLFLQISRLFLHTKNCINTISPYFLRTPLAKLGEPRHTCIST